MFSRAVKMLYFQRFYNRNIFVTVTLTQGSRINPKRFCIGVLDSFELSYSVWSCFPVLAEQTLSTGYQPVLSYSSRSMFMILLNHQFPVPAMSDELYCSLCPELKNKFLNCIQCKSILSLRINSDDLFPFKIQELNCRRNKWFRFVHRLIS